MADEDCPKCGRHPEEEVPTCPECKLEMPTKGVLKRWVEKAWSRGVLWGVGCGIAFGSSVTGVADRKEVLWIPYALGFAAAACLVSAVFLQRAARKAVQ